MSINFSKVYGDVTVEVWSGRIGDIALAKIGPVIAAAYPTKSEAAYPMSNYMVVAHMDGAVVGGMFLLMSSSWDESDVTTANEAVLPTHQRRGIGSKMYDGLKLWAATAEERVKIIYSHVDVGDKVGEAFISKQDGFSQTEENDKELTFEYVCG